MKKALAVGVPKATILTHFYPEVTVEKMSSLVLEYIGRSSKCYHIGTGNVVYCAYVKKNVFYKSEFVERFLELSLFYGLSSPLNSEMICIFPYF